MSFSQEWLPSGHSPINPGYVQCCSDCCLLDSCIPAQLKVVSYNITSVTLSWIVPNDINNTFLSFVSLFSSGKEIENHTTKYKEITITGLLPFAEYNVSISSLCNGTESIPARIGVQTGPSPPMNLAVVEQGVGFAFVRWTAPNDPNKDNYTYDVTWYQYEYQKYSRTVHGTEINITSLTPARNYTVSVTSSHNSKSSLPATITFTTVPCAGKVRAEGWISSGYPLNMYLNTDCVWDIEAPLGHIVVLTVVDLNYYYYYSSSQCYRTWLAVGYNQTSDRDVTMCRYSDVGRRIISTTNTLRLFYHAIPFNVTLSSQEAPSPSPSSAVTQVGTYTTVTESPSSVSTVKSTTHLTSTRGETTISTPDTTSQPGSSATTHTQVVATISTTTGLIKMKVNLKMTATNENYLQEMQNKNSTTYKEFVTKLEYEIFQSLKGVSENFSKLVILNLTAS
uniref:tenascin-like isoform X2 n=1 Tax=Myxine glutinosa TaxID=7769 RepID=UPI00358E18B5